MTMPLPSEQTALTHQHRLLPAARQNNHFELIRHMDAASGMSRAVIWCGPLAASRFQQAVRRRCGSWCSGGPWSWGENGEFVMRARLCGVIVAVVAGLAAGCGTGQA